jgi:hypothetical protein
MEGTRVYGPSEMKNFIIRYRKIVPNIISVFSLSEAGYVYSLYMFHIGLLSQSEFYIHCRLRCCEGKTIGSNEHHSAELLERRKEHLIPWENSKAVNGIDPVYIYLFPFLQV